MRNNSQILKEMLLKLHEINDEMDQFGILHSRSAIEKPRENRIEKFYNSDLFPKFRAYDSPLRGGTMRWPNRRYRYDNMNYTPGFWGKILDIYEDWKGKRFLINKYNQLTTGYPQKIKTLINDTECGEPFGIYLDGGVFITEPVLQYGMFLKRLYDLLEKDLKMDPLIVEIGGGAGGFARLLKKWRPKTKIILVDFPERLILQAYFLMDSFPEDSFSIFDSALPGVSSDFTLMPTWGLSHLTNSVDLFINTHSFQEMTNKQVDYYLSHINRLCEGWFYCINRYEKKVGDEIVRHPKDNLRSEGWIPLYEESERFNTGILESLYKAPQINY